jgi:hypothetical protein
MTAPRLTGQLLRDSAAAVAGASHPSGGRAIVPYGRKASDRSQRNIRASLRRAARGVAT